MSGNLLLVASRSSGADVIIWVGKHVYLDWVDAWGIDEALRGDVLNFVQIVGESSFLQVQKPL